jgi:hypothetical protein
MYQSSLGLPSSICDRKLAFQPHPREKVLTVSRHHDFGPNFKAFELFKSSGD